MTFRREVSQWVACCAIVALGGMWAGEGARMDEHKVYQVAATVYHPTYHDSRPNETASGLLIDPTVAAWHLPRFVPVISGERILAISQDLRRTFQFGDYVHVEGVAPELCGRWQVLDTMADYRIENGVRVYQRNMIDMLVPKTVMGVWKQATVRLAHRPQG